MPRNYNPEEWDDYSTTAIAKTNYNPEEWNDYFPQVPTEIEEPEEMGFFEGAKNVAARGALGVGELLANAVAGVDQAVDYYIDEESGGFDLKKSATDLAQSIEKKKENYPIPESGVMGTIAQGAESAITSLGTKLPGAATGAAIGLASPIGPVVGGIIGYLASVPGFMSAQYNTEINKYTDRFIKAGYSPEEARKKAENPALASATFEGAGEWLSDIVDLALLGTGSIATAGAKPMLAQTLKEFIKAGVYKTALKKGVGIIGAETIGEVFTDVGQTITDLKTGSDIPISEIIKSPQLWGAIKDHLGPIVVASTIFGGLGAGGHIAINANIRRTLEDSNQKPESRKWAAKEVEKAIAKESPELAKVWNESIGNIIDEGKSIDLSEGMPKFLNADDVVETTKNSLEGDNYTDKRTAYVDSITAGLADGTVNIDMLKEARLRESELENPDPKVLAVLNDIITKHDEVTDGRVTVGEEALQSLENFKASIIGADSATALNLKKQLIDEYPWLEDQANEAIINTPQTAVQPPTATEEVEQGAEVAPYTETGLTQGIEQPITGEQKDIFENVENQEKPAVETQAEVEKKSKTGEVISGPVLTPGTVDKKQFLLGGKEEPSPEKIIQDIREGTSTNMPEDLKAEYEGYLERERDESDNEFDARLENYFEKAWNDSRELRSKADDLSNDIRSMENDRFLKKISNELRFDMDRMVARADYLDNTRPPGEVAPMPKTTPQISKESNLTEKNAEVGQETVKQPWEISDLATTPNISIGYIQAKKQADGSFKLFYKGTANEVFRGEKFKSAAEARNFFKVQQSKAQEAQHGTEKSSKTGKAVQTNRAAKRDGAEKKQQELSSEQGEEVKSTKEKLPEGYIRVKTPEEWEKITGETLSEGAKKAFGKIKPDDKLYTIEYVQKVFGKGKIPARVIATSPEEAKRKLPDFVAYADTTGKIMRSKIISVESAMESKYVNDYYKGIAKLPAAPPAEGVSGETVTPPSETAGAAKPVIEKGYYIKWKPSGLGGKKTSWILVNHTVGDKIYLEGSSRLPITHNDVTDIRTDSPDMGRGEIVYKDGKAVGTNTAFFSPRKESEETLVALHNTTEKELMAALESGGLAMPSIAVTGKDIPYDSYGEITLIGNKDLVDPKKGTLVFH